MLEAVHILIYIYYILVNGAWHVPLTAPCRAAMPQVVGHEGVLDCVFHPTQPWLFTAGADSLIHLYCN